MFWHGGHTHRYRRRHVKHIEHFHFGWCWTPADRHPAHVPIPGAVEGSMIQKGNQGKVGRSETAVFPVFTEAMALCQRLSSRWSSSGLSLAWDGCSGTLVGRLMLVQFGTFLLKRSFLLAKSKRYIYGMPVCLKIVKHQSRQFGKYLFV